jgi:hypothetical protein
MKKIRLLPLIFLIMSLSCTPRRFSLLPKTSLEILQYNLEKTSGTTQIVGVARNNGDAKLDYAEVKGKFYDKNGTLLGSAFDSSTDLSPRGIWEFTISYPTEREAHPSLKILSYRLEKGSSEAKIIGQAQNDGDVILSFVQITGNFYRREAHPSLKILSCKLEKDDSTAKAVGEVQNDGDVRLSYTQIEATFYDAAGSTLATGTTSIVDLEVGGSREYTIFYPGSDYEKVDQVSAKVTSTEYDEEDTLLASSIASTTNLEVGETWDFSILYPKEDYEEVDHVTVEVTTTDYPGETHYEPAEQVDHVTVEVGTLRGRTIMP